MMSSASLREMQPRNHQRFPTGSRGWIAVAKVTEVTPFPSFAFTFTCTVRALAITLKKTSKIPTLQKKRMVELNKDVINSNILQMVQKHYIKKEFLK